MSPPNLQPPWRDRDTHGIKATHLTGPLLGSHVGLRMPTLTGRKCQAKAPSVYRGANTDEWYSLDSRARVFSIPSMSVPSHHHNQARSILNNRAFLEFVLHNQITGKESTSGPQHVECTGPLLSHLPLSFTLWTGRVFFFHRLALPAEQWVWWLTTSSRHLLTVLSPYRDINYLQNSP